MSEKNKYGKSNRIFPESTKSRRGLFFISGSNNFEKRQSSQKCIRFKKNKGQLQKMKLHIPGIEDLVNQITTEITRLQNEPS